MAVTCHYIENYEMKSCLLDCCEVSEIHTSENLAEELLKVAREWKIEHKVVCCVTDNAANIVKAIKLLKWTHLPCLAHTINLIVSILMDKYSLLKIITPQSPFGMKSYCPFSFLIFCRNIILVFCLSFSFNPGSYELCARTLG